MKDFVIDPNSWHFRLIKALDRSAAPGVIADIKNNNVSFCKYWGFLFTSIVMIAVVIGFLGVVAYLVIMLLTFFGVIVALILDFPFEPTGWWTQVALYSSIGAATVAVIIGLIVQAVKIAPMIKLPVREHKEPGLFATKYQSWKLKVCPRVVLKDE